MKTLFLFIFLISGSKCIKQNNIYIVKFKNCENIVVPGDVLLENQKIASLIRIQSMNENYCIGEIKVNKGINLNSSMSFYYKQVFIGDSYIEINVDSLKLSSANKLITNDTILIKNIFY